MGGIGIALRDNNHINYLNPASYTAIDSMSFLFDFGIMGNYTYTESNIGNDPFYGMSMDHLALSFPITKWWGASIGVLPYSKVGYSIKEVYDDDINIGLTDYLYTGNGGVNQLYLGTAVSLFKNLSLGVNFKYLFGSIDLSRSVGFPTQNTRSFTEVQSTTIIDDFIVDLGLQYSHDFNEKYNLTLGVIFDNKTSVSAENRVLKTNTFPGSPTPINDSTLLDPKFIIEEDFQKGNILIPAFAVGRTQELGSHGRVLVVARLATALGLPLGQDLVDAVMIERCVAANAENDARVSANSGEPVVGFVQGRGRRV